MRRLGSGQHSGAPLNTVKLPVNKQSPVNVGSLCAVVKLKSSQGVSAAELHHVTPPLASKPGSRN